ncbi:MAG: TIGR00725 family protein [Promethearchaeota archaeon]
MKTPYNFKSKAIIGVCGGAVIDEQTYNLAVELGREIAKKGYILACGGLFGTMEAVCKGSKEEGGLTIGIIPGLQKESANSFVDIVIPTGIGENRNSILVATADGIITVAGEAGTLNEMSLAWRMKKKIVALASSGGWSTKLAGQKIDDTRSDKILSAETPKEAVSLLIQSF